MSDGNDGDDEPAVVDLVDGAVMADADAPGVAASELLSVQPPVNYRVMKCF